MSMNNLKFHIILPYYKRQKLVSNALTSVLKSNYDNWFLTFIDDSGNRGFEEIFNKYGFKNENSEYISIGMSDDEKVKVGGSIFGSFINDAIQRIHSDIIIILCDDDALTKNYMSELNTFYNENDSIMWSYCHVLFYNPDNETYDKASKIDNNSKRSLDFINKNTEEINPRNKVDSSQVTFRRNVFINYDVQFPSPKTANLDADVFGQTYKYIGGCHFNNIIGQCKASFIDQLGFRIHTKRGEYVNL